MAFTKKERDWVLERDEHTSQMRHYTEEKGFHTLKAEDCRDCGGRGCGLHVHHIDPQRNGGGDTPWNAITLFACEHTGRKGKGKYADPTREFVVHSDMIEAYTGYDGTNDSFKKVFEAREQALQEGRIYHNNLHDIEMLETAFERTMNRVVRGFQWPLRRGKK